MTTEAHEKIMPLQLFDNRQMFLKDLGVHLFVKNN